MDPVSDIQLNQLKIEWIPVEQIRPNKYNPNKMTWHDRQLLKQSLLEDGWTQPIVTLPDGTIVDGEQRWAVSNVEIKTDEVMEIILKMEDNPEHSESILQRIKLSHAKLLMTKMKGEIPTIASITGGLVPRTVLDLGDDAHKMISTIRHNRARGVHQLDAMAEITQDLIALGLDFDDLETRLGMDDEEIGRFIVTADEELEAMLEEIGDFSESWEPVHISGLTDDEKIAREIQLSADAAKESKEYQTELRERQEKIERDFVEAIGDDPLTQEEKTAVRDRIVSTYPEIEEPEPVKLKKLTLFFTPDEYERVAAKLGDTPAKAIMEWVDG